MGNIGFVFTCLFVISSSRTFGLYTSKSLLETETENRTDRRSAADLGPSAASAAGLWGVVVDCEWLSDRPF